MLTDAGFTQTFEYPEVNDPYGWFFNAFYSQTHADVNLNFVPYP